MKKAKIMLVAIILLAIVGGTLAFNARRFALDYCVSIFGGGICPVFSPGLKVGGTRMLYYTLDDGSQCQDNLRCTTASTWLTSE
jgi:hypothetical protein